MRKLFLFLFAALMSAGMYATTEVTITNSDFPMFGTSFTKDGVTVSAGMIDSNQGNINGPGSFSTTLGNFTKIEVTANNVSIFGPGWNGTPGKKTWTGNASSLSFNGGIMGNGQGVTLKFTIAEPAPAIENSITINGTPQVGDNSISLTYYFDPANVPGICCNAPTLKVKCAADNQWDEKWLSLNNISSGTTTITLDELGSFQEGKSYDVCFAYNNGSWVDEVFQSFTPAASTPEPEPATTVVTITDSDFPAWGKSCTKDGVTVSAEMIDGMYGNIGGPGSFSTTLGNFTQIEVNAMDVNISGEGWSGNSEKMTWTGNASSVSFTGDINGDEEGVTLKFTIEPASTPAPAEDVNITPNVDPDHAGVYYSTFFDSANKYALPENVEAYVATLDGANLLLSKIADAGQTIPEDNAVILKSTVTPFTLSISDAEAVPVNAINSLEGSDVSIATPNNCYVLAGNNGVGFYHYTASMLNPHKAYVIYSGTPNQAPKKMPFVFNGEQTATGVENVQGDNVQSTKVFRDGQLVIIRNGVEYNAAGQIVK